MIIADFRSASPFPLDLGFLGMPGCHLFTGLAFTDIALLDGSGTGSYPVSLSPAAQWLGLLFYTQWACLDPAANAFGLTTSNYGRVLCGN